MKKKAPPLSECDGTPGSLLSTIPDDVMRRIAGRRALESGFGAGPSWVAGKVEVFGRPVRLARALVWLERYRHAMRDGHVMLDDRTVLFFRPDGFLRYDDTPCKDPPRPGVTVRHS